MCLVAGVEYMQERCRRSDEARRHALDGTRGEHDLSATM